MPGYFLLQSKDLHGDLHAAGCDESPRALVAPLKATRLRVWDEKANLVKDFSSNVFTLNL